MSTSPFPAAVAQLVTVSHRQRITATVQPPTGDPITLDVEDYNLKWDERRAPRATATLTCTLTPSLDLDALDPCLYVRVTVRVGYYLPGVGWDDQTVAVLHARRRIISRPRNTVTLELSGAEALLIDRSWKWASEPNTDTTGTDKRIGQWVADMIGGQFYGTPSEGTPVTVTNPGAGPLNAQVNYGPDYWQAFEDAIDQIDSDLYDDGTEHFWVTPRPTVGAPSHLLTVGESGTLLTSDSTVTRDDWSNYVVVIYPDGDPTLLDPAVYGYARVTAGPYTSATAGDRMFTLYRPGLKTTVDSATAVAKSILRRMLSRSRTYELDAISAWWVRPGQTVAVTLPTGGTVNHIVSSVTFLTGWRMSLTTRLPDGVSTIGE